MLLLVTLLAVFTSMSSAFEQKDFFRNPIGRDIHWTDLANLMKMSEAQVKDLAPVNRKSGLRSGEWIANHDLGIGPYFAWYYHMGDQAKVGLEQQLKGLPKEIRTTVQTLIEKKVEPKKSTLKWGDHLLWMAFQKGRKPFFVEDVVCLFQNPATGKMIAEIPVYIWEGTGIGYAQGCFNIFALPDIPKSLATPEAEMAIPTPEPTDTPQPEPTKAPIKADEPSVNPLWGQGVLWLVPEYVSAESLDQFNFYGGLEWRRKLSNSLQWTVRGEVGPGWNFPEEGPETMAQTSSLRTGLRFRLIDKAPAGLDIEVGALGWFHSEHYSMFRWDNGPSYLEGDPTEISGGGYARLLGKSKNETYYEFEYRNAGKESSISGNLSTEPKRFYGEIGGSVSDYSELDDDGIVYRQEGTFTEYHAKAGYKVAVKRPFIIAATYQTWKYSSDVWEIDWSGPGLYIESRFDPKGHWRAKVHAIYFNDRKDGPPDEPKNEKHEIRVQAGLTYSW